MLATMFQVILAATTAFFAIFYCVISCFAFHKMKTRKYSQYPEKVSAIISAYNEEGVIDNLLKKLRNSSFPIDEIIVLDDNSTDSTYEVAKKMNAAAIRNETKIGKAATLNKGAKIAKGDIMVVFDADNCPEKNCVKHLIKHFDSKDVGAVTGVVKILSDGFASKLAALEFSLCFYLFQPFSAKIKFFPILHGAYFGIRRGLASFDKDALTEDFDISVNIASRGYRIEFEPEAISYISPPPSFSLFARQRERWIRGAVEVCFKHKGFWKRVFPHLGFFGLFLKALGYSLPLVWASNFTFLWLCFLFGEFFLMNVALFSLVTITFIAFLANFRAKNKAKDILILPFLGYFYFFFVVYFFVKAVVFEYFGFKSEFDKIPHMRS
jgi:cellulose synthase/poly-beta-1,6-N-acetylglucosamine synthase-like glycosyltransferase